MSSQAHAAGKVQYRPLWTSTGTDTRAASTRSGPEITGWRTNPQKKKSFQGAILNFDGVFLVSAMAGSEVKNR